MLAAPGIVDVSNANVMTEYAIASEFRSRAYRLTLP
jgi:hypothetical protein